MLKTTSWLNATSLFLRFRRRKKTPGKKRLELHKSHRSNLSRSLYRPRPTLAFHSAWSLISARKLTNRKCTDGCLSNPKKKCRRFTQTSLTTQLELFHKIKNDLTQKLKIGRLPKNKANFYYVNKTPHKCRKNWSWKKIQETWLCEKIKSRWLN